MAENFTHNKNTVATPWHIAEFLTEYFEAKQKRVLDPTAGVGNFLEYSENKYGIEFDQTCYQALTARFPDGHFVNGSVFDQTEWLKEQNIEIVLMNPPFNQQKELMPKEYIEMFGAKGTDATKGLWWVKFVADTINRGRLAAIIPPGAVGSGNKKIDDIKADILEHHTLEAVLKLNNELFYPGAATSAVCLILALGKKHTGHTLFADFSDDGLVKNRTKGRIDADHKWDNIKQQWLEIMKTRPHSPEAKDGQIMTAVEKVTGADTWIPSSYAVVDNTPTLEDFKKTVRAYMDFEIKNVGGISNYLALHPELRPSKQEQISKLQEIIVNANKQIEELESLTDEEIHRPLDKAEYEKKRKEFLAMVKKLSDSE